MSRIFVFALILPLAACGLADTATTAAVAGKTKVEELQQAKETQEKVQVQLEQAAQQAQERINAAAAAVERDSR